MDDMLPEWFLWASLCHSKLNTPLAVLMSVMVWLAAMGVAVQAAR